MKKILSLVLILTILTLALMLASCKEKEHVHTPVTVEAVAATCEEGGLTEGKQCSECGDILEAQKPVKNLGHSWSEITTLEEPTVFDEGRFYKYCKRCNKIEYGVLCATGSVGLSVSNGTVKMGTCTDTVIYIPKEYNEKNGDIKPVTKISADAFKNYGTITAIVFPNGSKITEIGNSAFEGCKSLVDIVLPNTVTTIGTNAFKGCESLAVINIPDGVKEIKSNTFEGCAMLDNVSLSDKVETIGASAFKGCESLKSIEILGNIKNLSNNVFEGCSSLVNIDIPDTVTSIGDGAFKGCVSLDGIVIPAGVKTYGKSAFEGCKNAIDEISFLEGTTIGEDAFKGCVSLEKINFLGTIPAYTYGDLKNLTEITIADGVTEIKDETFINCAALKWVIIPNSVVTIGKDAFYGCDNINYNEDGDGNEYLSGKRILMHVSKDLEGFVFDAQTEIVYSEAFNDCDKLLSIEIPETVIQIGYGAFNGCSSLESITIPYVGTNLNAPDVKSGKTTPYAVFGAIFGSDNYIGAYAVGQHSSIVTKPDGNKEEMWTLCYIPSTLKSVTVTAGVIPTNAFRNCHSIEYVQLGRDVDNIYKYAFLYCTSLVTIDFEDDSTVNSIGNMAFASCVTLENIVIPASVKNIDENAFSDCVSLAKVEFENGTQISKFASGLFSGCSALVDITIPTTVTTLGNRVFADCTSLDSIVIHSGIDTIGKGAFYGCKSLTNVEFEVVDGWFRAFNESALYGDNFIKTDIDDSKKVAGYLTDIYYNYVWRR